MTVSDAATLIRDRIAEFQALGGAILARNREFASVAFAAKEAGDVERRTAALEALSSGQAHYRKWETASGRLTELRRKVPGLGALGVIPIAAIIAVASAVSLVALAVAMTGIFRAETAQERLLDLVRRGDVSADEARRLATETAVLEADAPSNMFTQLGSAAKLLAFGAVAFVALRLVQSGKRP